MLLKLQLYYDENNPSSEIYNIIKNIQKII